MNIHLSTYSNLGMSSVYEFISEYFLNKVITGSLIEDINQLAWMKPLSPEIKRKEHQIFGWKEISKDELEKFGIEDIIGYGSYGIGIVIFRQIFTFQKKN